MSKKKKVTKPIGQIGPRDVSWERGGAGLAQQLVRHSKKLPAGRTGADLSTEEPSLGRLNTRSYSRSLHGVDFPVNFETSLSPPSLSLSPSPSNLPDLLGHPGGGGAVSRASGDGWGVVVKETTKSIVVDIDEVHEIRLRAVAWQPRPRPSRHIDSRRGI